jgi:multiple sugar transport system permease protein
MTAVGQSTGDDQTQERLTGLKRPIEASVRATVGRLFAAPLLAWLAVTVALPLAYCFWISVTNANTMGGPARFIGLANYVALLSNLKLLHPLGLTVAWAIGGAVVQTALAALAALLLQQRFRGRHIARTWIIASWVIPIIVTAFLRRWMLKRGLRRHQPSPSRRTCARSSDRFPRKPFLRLCHGHLDQRVAMVSLYTLLILAALTRIAPEYYEAARVEGATEWQVFRRATLPFIQPVLYAVGLLGTLWSVNAFEIIWLTTKGGPLTATTTMPVAI